MPASGTLYPSVPEGRGIVAGSGPGYGDGPIKWVVASLTGVNFIFVALVFGFLLYLADLPTKARVFREGDPAHHIDLPSRALASAQHYAWRGADTLD